MIPSSRLFNQLFSLVLSLPYVCLDLQSQRYGLVVLRAHATSFGISLYLQTASDGLVIIGVERAGLHDSFDFHVCPFQFRCNATTPNHYSEASRRSLIQARKQAGISQAKNIFPSG